MTPTKKISHYVRIAQLVYAAAQASYPKYRRRKSKKTFSQHQLVACVLLMMYVNLSYRDFEDWLRASDQVCVALGLTTVPDHSTLNRAFHRLTEKRLRRLLAGGARGGPNWRTATTLQQPSGIHMSPGR